MVKEELMLILELTRTLKMFPLTLHTPVLVASSQLGEPFGWIMVMISETFLPEHSFFFIHGLNTIFLRLRSI